MGSLCLAAGVHVCDVAQHLGTNKLSSDVLHIPLVTCVRVRVAINIEQRCAAHPTGDLRKGYLGFNV